MRFPARSPIRWPTTPLRVDAPRSVRASGRSCGLWRADSAMRRSRAGVRSPTTQSTAPSHGWRSNSMSTPARTATPGCCWPRPITGSRVATVNAALRNVLASAAVFALFFAVGMLVDASAVSRENATGWVLAVGFPSLIITIVIRVYTRIRVRRAGTYAQSMRQAVTSAILLGLAFGGMLVVSIELFGLTSRIGPVQLMLTLLVTISIGGTALAAFENSWIAERERRTRLLEEAIAVDAMREDMVDINERLRVALNSDIDDALTPARVSIEERLIEQERLVTDDDWEAIAGELRSAADDTVKPLSRRLWAITAARMRPIRFRWVLRNIVTKQPFQPLLLSILALTGIANGVTTYGWALGVLGVLGAIVAIYVLLGGANVAMKRWPQHHAAIFIAATIAAMGAGLLNFPLRQLADSRFTWLEFIFGAILGTIAILMTSSIGSIRTHRDDVARTFQADIDREAVQVMTTSRQAAQLARESARFLHGSVQTRLIACAVAIEQAAEIGDLDAFQTALREAREVLRAPAR